jgi:hypothetical protein
MGNRDGGWAEWELTEQRENPWQTIRPFPSRTTDIRDPVSC